MNDASRHATPFDPTIIRASAGTGKTFRLSSRFIGLLAAHEEPDAVLATTFTRKAAGEIHDRVLMRLAAAALDEPGQVAELRESTHDPLMTADRARELLVALLGRLHRLSVCTLDSFFIRVAGSFTLELALPPGWRVCEEVADQRLRAEAIGAMLEADDPQHMVTLLRTLNPGEHRRAVHDQIATVIGDLYAVYQRQHERAAWCWIQPIGLMSEELVQREIEAFVAVEPHLPLTKQGKPSKRWVDALRANIEAARTGDWKAFTAKGIAAAIVKPGGGTFYGEPIPKPIADAYALLIAHARATLLDQLRTKNEATYDLLTRFAVEYRRLQLAARSVRFDTVTHALADAAFTDDRLDELYYRLDGRLRHLLLDEFQDTSGEQWRVLRPIADQINAESAAERRSFFCVGDVKQAIYGWRGGVAGIFDTLEQRWPEIEVEHNDTTWRCSPPVVEAVNEVFGSLTTNAALADQAAAAVAWSDAFRPHGTHRTDRRGYVRVETAPAAATDSSDDHAADRDDDESPAATLDTQAGVTLTHAASLVQRIADAAPGATIGVLVRRNAAVARLIFELRRLGLIASEEGGNPLTDSPAVVSLLALVRMADHPGDTAARFLVANSPVGALVGFTHHADDAAAQHLAAGVRARLMGDGYGPTLWAWVSKLAGRCDGRDLSRLLQLVELGHAYADEATLRPGDFVRYVENQRVADPTASSVRVMTVHQAKGLEFDAVVLPELEVRVAGLTPTVLAEHDDVTEPPVRITRYAGAAHQSIEPRLKQMADADTAQRVRESLSGLYVAMTRPKHALYLVLSPSKPTERKPPATHAGIVRSALVGDDPIDPSAMLYERGDAAWWGGDAGAAPSPPPARSTPPKRPKRVELADATERTRGLTRRSPSSLEGGWVVDLARQMRLDAGGARQRGTEMHKLFERIEWLGDDTPAATGRFAAEFAAMIARPAVRAALSRSAYPADAHVTVLREQGFAIRLDDTLLTGSFDRVVLIERDGSLVAADLLDFKTDTVDEPGALDARVHDYRPQIDAYRRALAAMYRLDPAKIGAKLLFVAVGEVVDVS